MISPHMLLTVEIDDPYRPALVLVPDRSTQKGKGAGSKFAIDYRRILTDDKDQLEADTTAEICIGAGRLCPTMAHEPLGSTKRSGG